MSTRVPWTAFTCDKQAISGALGDIFIGLHVSRRRVHARALPCPVQRVEVSVADVDFKYNRLDAAGMT